MKEHLSEKGGSMWTRLHKPIKVILEYKRVPTMHFLGLESKVTAETMLKYGVNNVSEKYERVCLRLCM